MLNNVRNDDTGAAVSECVQSNVAAEFESATGDLDGRDELRDRRGCLRLSYHETSVAAWIVKTAPGCVKQESIALLHTERLVSAVMLERHPPFRQHPPERLTVTDDKEPRRHTGSVCRTSRPL